MSKIKLKANESGTGILTIEAPNTDTDKTLTLPTSDGTLVTTDGTTFTGNVNFGDNDKAIFGGGSDLEIYHDGSNSYITDAGTGDLIMAGSNLRLQDRQGYKYLYASDDGNGGAVTLYHLNAAKLATTSTGIDVTGSVTADGLKAEGSSAGGTYLTSSSGSLGGDIKIEHIIDSGRSLNTINSEDGNNSGIPLAFATANTERMRLDGSGNLMVGKSSVEYTSEGAVLRERGEAYLTSDGRAPLVINRLTSNGGIVILRKDGTDSGYLGVLGTELYITSTSGSDSGLNFGSNRIIPCTTSGGNRDNIIDLGNSASRFDDIYATNTSIQTSDQNEKQQIASLTDAEMNVAKRLSALFKTFKWNSSVEEKGDNARTHSGIIAQDMQQAFTDEGLDAGNYAMFISSTWWEKEISVDAVEEETDEEGNVITESQDAYTYMDTKEEETEGYTERTRLGVRYPELFAFISAYNDQRFVDLETRITALENA